MKYTRFLELEVLCIIIILLGVSLNFIAIRSNNNMMPVYNTHVPFENLRYCEFNNFSEINFPYLSDVISTNFGIISIGDILVTGGFLFLVILISSYITRRKNDRKNQKKS